MWLLRSIGVHHVSSLLLEGSDFTNGLIGIYQFDQSNQTLSFTGTTTLGIGIGSVAWCPSCTVLAAGGQDSSANSIIQLYSFDPLNPGIPEAFGSVVTLSGNSSIGSLDWCDSCTYLAAGAGSSGVSAEIFGLIQIYSFNSETGLSPIANQVNFEDLTIGPVKWCNNCSYLATIVSSHTPSGNISTLLVYSFDPEPPADLSWTVSYNSGYGYISIDWCDECNYIAAGGINQAQQGIIDIYKFDTLPTPSLSPVASMVISSSTSEVISLEWCQGCDNLAVVAVPLPSSLFPTSLLLYHFDSSKNTLTLIQSQPLSFSPFSIDWCGNCCNYFAVGGGAGTKGLIQLFKGNATCLQPPTNLTAQKIFHRFPTQVDIINQLCWSAATGAVAYNVYADAALTILLATIPAPSVCYSQHQIAPCKTVTYYVTSVDASGNHSEPAVLTI